MKCTTHHHACDCRESAHVQEIEHLNSQVAMLRGACGAIIYYDECDPEEDLQMMLNYADALEKSKNALYSTSSDWLADHDKQVRDDALEKSALVADRYIGCSAIAAEIRALKGRS